MKEESVIVSKDLLERGRNGETDALGQLLELHRPYLHLLADRSLQGDIRTRIGASDIVQQTCIAAIKGFGDLKRKLATSVSGVAANRAPTPNY